MVKYYSVYSTIIVKGPYAHGSNFFFFFFGGGKGGGGGGQEAKLKVPEKFWSIKLCS